MALNPKDCFQEIASASGSVQEDLNHLESDGEAKRWNSGRADDFLQCLQPRCANNWLYPNPQKDDATKNVLTHRLQ